MNKNTVKTINSAISNFGGAMNNGGSFVKKAENDFISLDKYHVISGREAVELTDATEDISKRINLNEAKLSDEDIAESKRKLSDDETFVESELHTLQLKAQGTYSKSKASNFTTYIANQNYQNNCMF